MLKILFIFLTSSILAAPPPEILYKTRIGKLQDARALYRAHCEKTGSEDLEIIQHMAYMIIEQGWRSNNQEEQLLAIYGAGTARDPQMLHILECGLGNPNPQIQLASLYFLTELCDDRADALIKKAMASDYLLIRYEAAKILALKKDLNAIPQVEGLMCKLDPQLYPLFPPFFSLAGDKHSTAMLKKFFSDRDAKVRLSTILSCLDHKRDDMLPHIRTLATHGSVEEQEAALFTLGALKDSSSIKLLESTSCSTRENIRLASLMALYNLGQTEVACEIESLAKQGSIFAIAALGAIPGSEDLLSEFLKCQNLILRYNATLALLRRKDPRCVEPLLEILIKDARDMVMMEVLSPGMVLTSWKPVFSVTEKLDKASGEAEMVISIREEILKLTLDLPTKDFFYIADKILCSKNTELVPALITLIETLHNEEAIQFLKAELHRAGAPLVRAYCNLALFRMNEPGPYAQYVRQWTKDLKHIELITFRPLIPKTRGESTYSMTPQDTSRLFIEALTALANQKDPEAIDALLNSMCHGNPKNRYALAGLLVRATE